MVKKFGLVALAAVAALVLGFGSRLGSSAPTASAETTGVTVIGCEFIAGAVDGVTTNALTDADVSAACGDTALPPTGAISVASLASAVGDKDGKLEKSDFATSPDEDWDDNQISVDCTAAFGAPGASVLDLTFGFSCSLVAIVYVNDEQPTTLDLPSGLASVQNGSLDFICNTDGVTLTTDNDCSDAIPNNGDGVVLFQILNDSITSADDLPETRTVNVIQEAVAQSFDVNVVGSANDVKLTLVEDLIESHKTTANLVTCKGDPTDTTTPGQKGIPGTAVNDTEAVTDPTSTLAYAQAFDQDDNILTRVPVFSDIDPASAIDDVVAIGIGNAFEGVTGNTFFTLKPATDAAPVAAYFVLCGGTGTGTADIVAQINIIVGGQLSSEDTSTQEITVGGVPSSLTLTASASAIKCDGTETATITAKVTDSAGNNVADGVPVSFSVVALGTANPINTVTAGGTATSVITPLSNSSAGVTVVVTAGDSVIATPVQTSIRVDCALPLVTQPTPVPTARPGVTGPDTGNGGYLAQGDSSFPMWALIVLAIGSITLVAGGAVARRAGK